MVAYLQKQEEVLAHLKKLRVDWVRIPFYWDNFIEPKKGEFNFEKADKMIKAFCENDINVLLIAGGSPDWSTKCDNRGGAKPPENVSDYVNFISEAASRYESDCVAWEIWNEPDNQPYWGCSPPNAQEYMDLLKPTYKIIKEKNPEAIVVGGAILIQFLNNPNYAYLDELLKLELLKYSDVVSVHIYPRENIDFITDFDNSMKQVKKRIDKYGGSEIWITETSLFSKRFSEQKLIELLLDKGLIPSQIKELSKIPLCKFAFTPPHTPGEILKKIEVKDEIYNRCGAPFGLTLADISFLSEQSLVDAQNQQADFLERLYEISSQYRTFWFQLYDIAFSQGIMTKEFNSKLAYDRLLSLVEEEAICGNGVCEDGENEKNCPEDCGITLITGRFGMDGADRRYLQTIAEIGDGESGQNGVNWGSIELINNQTGKHYYDWKLADVFFERIKASGREIQITLRIADWALERDESIQVTDPATGKKHGANIRLKPEYISNFRAFIKEFVRRYQTINLQIESEAENEWINAEGYIEALCIAKQSAKEINPQIQIMSGGFNMFVFFSLTPIQQAECLKNPLVKQKLNFIKEFIAKSKDNQECFDVLTVHPNRDYKDIPPMVEWFNQEMASHGYQKMMWADDMTSGHWLSGPFTSKEEKNILQKLEQDDPEAIQWYKEEQAKLLVKKIVTSFVSGLEKIYLSTDVDWANYHMSEWRHMGLLESNGNSKQSFYTYKLIVSKLDGFTKAEKLNDYAYEFTFIDKAPVFVLWNENGETTIDLSSHISTQNAEITHIVTELDDNNNPIYLPDEIVSASSIQISETPIFVEETGGIPQECELTSANWSTLEVVEGNIVSLKVKGGNCDGQTASLTVWKDDLIGDESVEVNPISIVFDGDSATGTWTAEWQEDGIGNPEYYFIAEVGGGEIKSEGLLRVTRKEQSVCGNGVCEEGEDEKNCPEDCQ